MVQVSGKPGARYRAAIPARPAVSGAFFRPGPVPGFLIVFFFRCHPLVNRKDGSRLLRFFPVPARRADIFPTVTARGATRPRAVKLPSKSPTERDSTREICRVFRFSNETASLSRRVSGCRASRSVQQRSPIGVPAPRCRARCRRLYTFSRRGCFVSAGRLGGWLGLCTHRSARTRRKYTAPPTLQRKFTHGTVCKPSLVDERVSLSLTLPASFFIYAVRRRCEAHHERPDDLALHFHLFPFYRLSTRWSRGTCRRHSACWGR